MKNFNIESLIVYGLCPSCRQMAPLVSILKNIYKCTECEEELEQYVNGVIKYLPMSNKKLKKELIGKSK